jgi:Uma2 family endonuclease
METSLACQDWVQAAWENFVDLEADPAYAHGKFYYHCGWMRVEMSPVGPSHAQDNSLIGAIVLAWALRRRMRIWGLTNVMLRRTGLQEAQPDLAYYLENTELPSRSNTPINIDSYGTPELVIEVSATTLIDDLNQKRLLYQALGAREYWVINTASASVSLFGFDPPEEVFISRLLPGLSREILGAALQEGQSEGDVAVVEFILNMQQNFND